MKHRTLNLPSLCKWWGLLLTVLLMLDLPASAESVAVVTHDLIPVTTLTREEVADLFLGKRNITIKGLSLIPLDVNDEPLREAFYQGVAEMSAMRVNAYWSRLVFSAQGRPPRKLPLAEAKSLVQSQPGMVTYVPDVSAAGFKILLRLP